MYGMILIFVVWASNPTAGDGQIGHSQLITVFPDKASCEAALPGYVQYQRGVEAGKGEKDNVGGWCIELKAIPGVGT